MGGARKRVYVMFRQLTFSGGQQVNVPLVSFESREQAEVAGAKDAAWIQELAGPEVTRAFMQRIGVERIAQGVLEMDQVDGVGLVIAGPQDMPRFNG